ncbi:MAG TPA: hypothetical protein VLI05_01860 [Candidatus Saccharimonadia bacterium]|nr:hypothetical protein [Candidatus Saccharimonadia bacterium]
MLRHQINWEAVRKELPTVIEHGLGETVPPLLSAGQSRIRAALADPEVTREQVLRRYLAYLGFVLIGRREWA